jgi:hypothetical protein
VVLSASRAAALAVPDAGLAAATVIGGTMTWAA